MYVRIFPPLVFTHLFFPLFFIIDLVSPLCLLPVWHLVGASGEGMMASPCDPIPSIPSPLSRPIPSLLLTILGDLHCKLSFFLPHFRSRTSSLFFPSSFIQPASERERPALQDRSSSTIRASSRTPPPIPRISSSIAGEWFLPRSTVFNGEWSRSSSSSSTLDRY